MPKKKPIVKRLDKLFEDITPEEAIVYSTPASHEDVMGGMASATVEVTDHQSTRAGDTVKRSPQNEQALSLAFQTGQNNWATLQVMDETALRVWSQEEQLLVKQVTDQLSLALENVRLFQETQSRAEELSVLNEMGRELSSKLEVPVIAEVVYRYTSRLMDTQNFFIALHDEKTEEKSYPLAFEDGQRVQLSPRKLGNGGFSDYIIRTKKAIFASADVVGHMKTLGIEFVPLHKDDRPPQCWLGVPMLIGERVIGLISVQNVQRSYVFDEHDRDILATIAGQAAIAIENARLFQEARRRAQETATLAEVGREISVTLDLATVLTRIATYAKDLFQAETSAVYLPETKGVGWRAIAVVGEDVEEIKRDPIQTGRGILGNIALSKVGKIVNDASSTAEAVTIQGTIDQSFEHILGVPILALDQVTGLMAVWRTGQGMEFSQAELDFLTSLARQAAIAIQNARLFNDVMTSQGQLSEALQIARLGYFEIDLKDRTVQLTAELYSLLGTTVEKEGSFQLPLETVIRNFIVEDDIAIMTDAITQATSAPEENPETEVEARFRTSDGRVIWVRSILKVERDLQGKPTKVLGSSQDITDRKINELTQAAITQISDAALTASRIEDLINTIHNVVGTLMPAKNFYIALYDADADLMTFPYYVDEHDAPMPPQKLGRGLTSYIIRTGRPLRTTPEIYAELEESGEVIGGGTRGVDWLGVPLRSEAGIRGVMAVQSYNPSIRITERHKEIL